MEAHTLLPVYVLLDPSDDHCSEEILHITFYYDDSGYYVKKLEIGNKEAYAENLSKLNPNIINKIHYAIDEYFCHLW